MSAYKGDKQWAPCFHGERSNLDAELYVRDVLRAVDPSLGSAKPDLESLLWTFGLAWYAGQLDGTVGAEIEDVKFGFYADQWVGVSVEVHRKSGEVERLWTEGDTFTLALAKTFERLKAGGVWAPELRDQDADDCDCRGLCG